MAIPVSTDRTASPAAAPGTQRGSFAIMTALFFLWGFMTVFNDILIPRFKEAFTLTYFQAMLVQFAFFGAYFVGALVYFVVSVATGDPIARIGYKNGVVLGLLISAAGSALFWPAATIASYPLFLGALFVVGLGFALLQIAANPYVTILGPEPAGIRGRSFLGVLAGRTTAHRDAIFAEVGSPGRPPPPVPRENYDAYAAQQAARKGMFWFVDYTGKGRAAMVKQGPWKYAYTPITPATRPSSTISPTTRSN